MANAMTEAAMAETLAAVLDGGTDEEGEPLFDGAEVMTFSDAGVMTSNKGIVISLPDGTQYQVTVVRSR